MLFALTKTVLGRCQLRLIVALSIFLPSAALADPPTIQIPHIDTPPQLSDFEDMQPSPRLAERC